MKASIGFTDVDVYIIKYFKYTSVLLIRELWL